MPDIINSSFDPRLPFPLDVRQQVQDMNALFAIPATSRWEGMVVYVRGAEIPYILKGGVTNSFWVPFQFNSGGGLLPNGIVIYGESQQSGNDILLNDAWVWRIDQVDYQSSDDVITIAPAAAGNVRVDIIVGDNLSNFVLVPGTEVASPGPAIEPNIPPNTVPLLRVEVNDTGITAFEDFALSAFVRFDIDNQGLIPSQRQNARTNIQALARDIADTHTGQLINNGKVIFNDLVASGTSFTLIKTGSSNSNGLLSLQNDVDGEVLRVTTSGNIYSSRQTIINSPFNTALFIRNISDTVDTIILYSNGTIFQSRSSNSTQSLRRDENYLTYPVTISGTGKLNDVALSNGVGAIKFSSGVTEVSGIDPNGDTKELLIWSNNPSGITLPAEDVLSIAANRFYRDVNIPYQTWVRLVYDGDLSRWVNSNTGELQETDARYFEVTSDVLTLKYILPDIAALQAFVRGPAVLAYVSDSLRGGYFNYVAEVDFVGVPDFGISFPAQDGGYWVRDFEGYVHSKWYNIIGDGTDEITKLQAAITAASGLVFELDKPQSVFAISGQLTGDSNTVYNFNGHRINQLQSWGIGTPSRHFFADTKTNITINNPFFYGKGTDFDNSVSANANGIYLIDCTNVKINEPVIKNVAWAGIELIASSYIDILTPDIEGTNNLSAPLGPTDKNQFCIQIIGASWTDITITNPKLRESGQGIITNANGKRLVITNVNIRNIAAEHGMYLQSNDGLLVNGGLISDCNGLGFKVQKNNSTAIIGDGGFIGNLSIVRPAEDGFHITSTATTGTETDPPSNLLISNITIHDPGFDFYKIEDAINTDVYNITGYNSGRMGATISNNTNVSCINHVFHGVGWHGISIPAAGENKNLTLKGFQIYDVSKATANTYDGVSMVINNASSNNENIVLEDIRIMDNQAVKTMRFGLYLAISHLPAYSEVSCKNIYLRNAINKDIRLDNAYTETDKPKLMESIDFNTSQNFPRAGVTIPTGSGINSSGRSFVNNAIPAVGTYKVGDIINNYSPTASGFMGWVCVTAGTPGTWKGFGSIEA